jgi:hypothetical protein
MEWSGKKVLKTTKIKIATFHGFYPVVEVLWRRWWHQHLIVLLPPTITVRTIKRRWTRWIARIAVRHRNEIELTSRGGAVSVIGAVKFGSPATPLI